MTDTQLTQWFIEKGFVLGLASCGHTGRKDAWTKTYGEHPALTVRYIVKGDKVEKWTSRGFGTFGLRWTNRLEDIRIVDGKLTIAL